jgi:hypothetical protein
MIKWKKFKFIPKSEIFLYKDYTWSIEYLKEIISKYRLPHKQIIIKDLNIDWDKVEIEQDYAMQSTRTEPIIIIEYLPGTLKVIDGNHRLYREMKLGKESIEAYVVAFRLQILSLKFNDMYNQIVREAKEKKLI